MPKEDQKISVIAPVLNDTVALESLLKQLKRLSATIEVVVVDGGNSEETAAMCHKYGALLVTSPPGRGTQMNRGASASQGDILWFLHTDAIIHPKSLDEIKWAMWYTGAAGGAFRFRLEQRHWYAALLDLGVRLRLGLLKLPYGDQAFFVRRSVFESMGGFKAIPFLEDIEFIRRLRGYGEVALLSVPIGVSSRRWESEGFFYTTLRNWLVTLAYFMGVSPERLVKWYRAVNSNQGTERAGGLGWRLKGFR